MQPHVFEMMDHEDLCNNMEVTVEGNVFLENAIPVPGALITLHLEGVDNLETPLGRPRPAASL